LLLFDVEDDVQMREYELNDDEDHSISPLSSLLSVYFVCRSFQILYYNLSLVIVVSSLKMIQYDYSLDSMIIILKYVRHSISHH
jgi:hypothetical protein